MQQQSTSLCDTKYKIVFLGNMGVGIVSSYQGKTSIIQRFVKDQFDQCNNVLHHPQNSQLLESISQPETSPFKTYRLQLWDTAGQQKYKSLVPAYLRDANCAVFVFDFSRKQTFQDLRNWIQLYRDHSSELSVAFVLGNKCDLMDEPQPQSNQIKTNLSQLEQQAKQFARKQNMIFRKVSARTGKDVMSSFQNIISQLLNGNKKDQNPVSEDPQERFENQVLQKMSKLRLQDIKQGKQSTSCCSI